ncbi:MAG: hypothetical protein GC151_13845 [Betaproteobacteria bacterium]|nr:hypothetical protein [Betaproteobacteria bacterium]
MDRINEASSGYLTASFYDKAGALAVPSTVSYRVDCITTGTAVRSATSLTAASQVEIHLTSDDNAIQVSSNSVERKRVTVTATYGSGDQVQAEYDYEVANLRFV